MPFLCQRFLIVVYPFGLGIKADPSHKRLHVASRHSEWMGCKSAQINKVNDSSQANLLNGTEVKKTCKTMGELSFLSPTLPFWLSLWMLHNAWNALDFTLNVNNWPHNKQISQTLGTVHTMNRLPHKLTQTGEECRTSQTTPNRI